MSSLTRRKVVIFSEKPAEPQSKPGTASQQTAAPQYLLPSSPFGITSDRYSDVTDPMIPLPQRNVMAAANRLNEYRYTRLSDKQRVFIDVYLSSGFNCAEAAQRAGYCAHITHDPTTRRYENACASVGKRIANSKHIAYGIQLAMDYHAERSKIVTDDLITELRHIAFSNVAD